MRLRSFQVEKFRNVVDSGEIVVEERVTCLVGKNEAGKSALLEALYLLNPAYNDTFNVEEQYPRWLAAKDRRSGDLNDVSPISVRLELEDHEWDEVVEALGSGVLTSRDLKVSKRYSGGRNWIVEWSEEAAVKNMLGEFPTLVAAAVKNQITLDGLREALEALEPVDEGSGPSDDEIDAARAVLADKGLDNTDVWNRLVGSSSLICRGSSGSPSTRRFQVGSTSTNSPRDNRRALDEAVFRQHERCSNSRAHNSTSYRTTTTSCDAASSRRSRST